MTPARRPGETVMYLCPFRAAWWSGVYPVLSTQFTLGPLQILWMGNRGAQGQIRTLSEHIAQASTGHVCSKKLTVIERERYRHTGRQADTHTGRQPGEAHKGRSGRHYADCYLKFKCLSRSWRSTKEHMSAVARHGSHR